MTIQHGLFGLGLLGISALVHAHPGGLDADGCHTCRTNCVQHTLVDGQYHCHRGNDPAPEPDEPPPLAEPERAEADESPLIERNYQGFTVWVNCAERGAERVRCNAQRDTGDFERSSTFKHDPELPDACQQTTTDAYSRPDDGQPTHDRGHLVPADELDHDEIAIAQTNFITNIVPMVSRVNRHGAWRETEVLTECYRDISELLVFAGVIWGNDASDDHYLASHGIRTPDWLWKVVIREDRVIAWIIPNRAEATRERLDEYLVTVRALEQRIGYTFPVLDYLKDEKPATTWIRPMGCEIG